MNADEIRSLRRAEPFEPFQLVLNDGRRFAVRKPFHLAISENNSRVLVVTGNEGAAWFAPDAVNHFESLAESSDISQRGAGQ